MPQFQKVRDILFLRRKGFAKLTPEAGRVSSTFILQPEVI